MIKWGIIGAGNIAQRFIKGLSYSQTGQLYAVASRTETKRQQFLKMYPGIVVYDDYDQLLNDPQVDVVYIATWHKAHYHWAKQALLHHIAVLCEKPATLSLAETEDLALTAKQQQTFFMEAMKTRFIPLVLEIKKQLSSGIIGDIVRIENRFCYDVSGANEVRYLFDQEQGGILNDVGSYNIASLLDYIHAPVQSITSKVQYLQGVDCHDCITITFQSGQIGYLEMAMDENKTPVMTIYGTQGKITCEPFYRPQVATIEINGQKPYIIEKNYIYDDFYTEIDEVHQCLENKQYQSQKMSLQDSINCITLTEQIRKTFKEENYEV